MTQRNTTYESGPETAMLSLETEISSNIDLIVRLKSAEDEKIFTFYVTAWSLQQASQVFSRFINPDPRLQQPPTEQYKGKHCVVIMLEDDHPICLATVLHLLHLNSAEIAGSDQLPWWQMHEIAIIWDKYDINLLIRPPWLDHWKNYMTKPLYEDWLFIAKVFKVNDGYADLTARLAVETCLSEETEGQEDWFRSFATIPTGEWPDFVRTHIAAERARIITSLNARITHWKKSFGGSRPRKLCTCYGQGQRYTRHTMLSNDIAALLSTPIEPLDSRPQAFQQFVTGDFRPRDISGWGTWEWEWSVLDFRRRVSKLRSHLSGRDMREVRYMLQNPDVYDLCPLEDSTMRVLMDFDDTISVIRGIDVNGNTVEFSIGQIIENAKDDPWNMPMQKDWKNKFLLGQNIVLVLLATLTVLLAIILGSSKL